MVGKTLPYSIFLVGIAFLLAFLLGTAIGMIAAWRRGGIVDNLLTPAFMSLGAFPAFFTSLLAVYFLGLKLGWFPIQHAYELGLEPGFNWDFLSSAFRHAQLPILVCGDGGPAAVLFKRAAGELQRDFGTGSPLGRALRWRDQTRSGCACLRRTVEAPLFRANVST